MDLIETIKLSKEKVVKIIDFASKLEFEKKEFLSLLLNQTLAMNFNAPSTRTQISFHASIAELGGSSYFIDPKTMHSEDLSDFVKVLKSYCCAYGVRLPNPGDIIDTKTGKKIWKYGDSEKYFSEIDNVEDHLPIISLRHDDGHPCQGLYELKTYKEALGLNNYAELKGKRLLITWTKGNKVKPWSPTLETLKIASKFGMKITICNPKEFSLDRGIIDNCKLAASVNGGELIETTEFNDSFNDQDIVYGRNWVSSEFIDTFSSTHSFLDGLGLNALKEIRTKEIEKMRFSIKKYNNRTVSVENMILTNNARFINPMPFEKNLEATEDVWNNMSLQDELLKNKLYIQKAILAFIADKL
ncbi:MAG: hypothetical protein KAT68_14145 [Bacteroidales bacterium]|nr:hypothetical protein [Bacteroidales bacterium]